MGAVAVLTGKKLDDFVKLGGSGHWVANKNRIRKTTYLVAVANAYWADSIDSHSQDKHGHAFLVGKISGTIPSPEDPTRLIIQISEYAEIDIPGGWQRQRNPVRYTNLEEFGINPDDLDWKAFPLKKQKPTDMVRPLTVKEAKLGLAKKFGVEPEQIEIVVRA